MATTKVMLIGLYMTLLGSVTAQLYSCSQPNRDQPWSFLPFGADAGDEELEEKSAELKLNVHFPFNQHAYGKLYINADGVISFTRPLPVMTPSSLPLSGASRLPLIAPYWANNDLNANNGQVYFRQSSEASNVLRGYQLMQNFNPSVLSGDFRNFRPSLVVVTTWRNVTFAGGNCNTPVNTFQSVMLTNGRHSFVFFLYGDITWTSSRLSGGNMNGLGGSSALVGYGSGFQYDNYMLNCSLRACIRTTVTGPSNTRYNAVWSFRLDKNKIHNAGCLTGGPVTLSDGSSPVLGGKPVYFTGPCFNDRSDIRCRFGTLRDSGGVRMSSEVTGSRVYDGNTHLYRAMCVTPMSEETGEFPVELSVDGGRTWPFYGNISYVLEDPSYQVTINKLEVLDNPTTRVILTWDQKVLKEPFVTVEFLIMLPGKTSNTMEIEGIPLYDMNTSGRPGYVQLPIGLPRVSTMPQLTTYGALRVFSHYDQNKTEAVRLYSQPLWSLFFYNQWVIELTYRSMRQMTFGRTAESDRYWNNIRPFVTTPEARRYLGLYPTRERLASFMAEGRLDNFTKSNFAGLCGRFKDNDVGNPLELLADLPRVPCSLVELLTQGGFKPDVTCSLTGSGRFSCRYRPNADNCFIIGPTSSGHAQRACYDESQKLITSSSDRQSAGNGQWYFRSRWFENAFFDERGHAHCCVYSDTCRTWSERRPSITCTGGGDVNYPAITTTTTQATTVASLPISESSGPALGGNPIYVDLPQPASSVICRIGGESVEGMLVSNRRAVCIAPLSYSYHTVAVKVSLDGGRTFLSLSARYTYEATSSKYAVRRPDLSVWERPDQRPYITWDPSIFNDAFVNIDYVILLPEQGFLNAKPSPTMKAEATSIRILPSTPSRRGSGRGQQLPVGLPYVSKMPPLTTYGALEVYDSSKSNKVGRISVWTSPFWSRWFFNQYMTELIYRKKTNTPIQMTDESNNIWSSMSRYVTSYIRTRTDAAEFIASGGLDQWTAEQFSGYCAMWATSEAQNRIDFSDLTPVPCTIEEAQRNRNYEPDPLCEPTTGGQCLFQPKARMCFIYKKANLLRHGKRACYDQAGQLITTSGDASSGNAMAWFPADNWYVHDFYDTRGHMHCCVMGNNCTLFTKNRPATSCRGYKPDDLVTPTSGNGFSPASFICLMIAGGAAGFIAVVLITCLGLPNKDKYDKRRMEREAAYASGRSISSAYQSVGVTAGKKKKNTTKKNKRQKTKAKAAVTAVAMKEVSERESKKKSRVGRVKRSKKDKKPRDSAENFYVEPEPYPYVNNKRRSRESDRKRNSHNSGANAEYIEFDENEEYYHEDTPPRRKRENHGSQSNSYTNQAYVNQHDSYNNQRNSYNSQRDSYNKRDSHFSNPLATSDSVYSESNHSGRNKRDSHLSEMSNVSSKRTERSDSSLRSSISPYATLPEPEIRHPDPISEGGESDERDDTSERDNQRNGHVTHVTMNFDDDNDQEGQFYNDDSYTGNPGATTLIF